MRSPQQQKHKNLPTVTVRTQNILVNVNNFLFIRQQKARSIWLYLGCLTGGPSYCDFNLPIGHTSYTDKMVMHTLVQGLEDATLAKERQNEHG